eukprot:jgi/Botrbrau1/14103/Bobra.182_3s0046.1
MKRSFHRKGAVSFADPTTRPGPRGQTLISTGIPDFDRLLGGGLPLGCVLLLIEEGPSPHADNLIRHFVAQGVACGHRTLWIVPQLPPEGPSQLLPALSSGKSTSHASQKAAVKTSEDEEVKLRIAWQYEQYMKKPVQPASHVGSREEAGESGTPVPAARWCHQFDMSKSMDPGFVSRSLLEARACSGIGSFADLAREVSAFCLRDPACPLTVPQTSQGVQARQGDSKASGAGLPGGSSREALAGPPGTLAGRPGDRRPPSAPAMGLPAAPCEAPAVPQKDVLQHLAVEAVAGNRDGDGTAPLPRRLPVQATAAGPLPELSDGVQLIHDSNSDSARNTVRTAEPADRIPVPTGAAGAREDTSGGPGLGGPVREPEHGTESGSATGVRIAVQSLGSPAWRLGLELETAVWHILRAVHHLKGVVRSSRTAAMISVPAGRYPLSLGMRLQHMCDAAVAVSGLPADSVTARLVPDPSSCTGVFRLLKLAGTNALARPLPEEELYVIRSKRRQMEIEAFHVDPDANLGDTERGPTGAKPSGRGSCGGSAGGDHLLDF